MCTQSSLLVKEEHKQHLIDVQSGWYLIKKHDTGEQRNYYFGDGKEVDGMKTEDELQLKRRSEWFAKWTSKPRNQKESDAEGIVQVNLQDYKQASEETANPQ